MTVVTINSRVLIGHDVFTVAFMKWNGVENGDLLALAAADGFDAVITKDTGMPYALNMEAPTNELDDIRPLIPALLVLLRALQPRTCVRVK